MENNDLNNLWQLYNKRLENKIIFNQQILKNLISRKSEFRFFTMKIQSLLGIIITPLIYLFIIIPMISKTEISPHLIIGTIGITIIIIYYFIIGIKYYKMLNIIKPAFEQVLKTKEKILKIRKFMFSFHKSRNYLSPLFAISFILVSWDYLDINSINKIIVLILAALGIFFWGKYKQRIYFQDRIHAFEQEMNEIIELNKI